ncbi:MAG TPA: amidohydrolase family protein [Allosphingosinicella sp.]|jgi:imidazolonepropionase-like amidohydrolase
MRNLLHLIAALALLLGACRAVAQPERPPQAIAYRGATLVDVRSGELRRVTIVARGETIEALLPPDAPIPAGAKAVDVAGLYAIPGLIDVHQHVENGRGRRAAEAVLRREVYSGVTAVRDMLGDARILADLSRAARFGELPAPDVDFAGLVAGPGYFIDGRLNDLARGGTPGKVPWIQSITAGTDLPLAIARLAGTGARGVKIYGNLDSASVERIAAEAHRQSLAVWAHAAVFPATPMEVIEAGADSVSHVCMLAYQTLAVPPVSYHDRAPLDQAALMRGPPHPALAGLFRAMKARGTVLDTTVSVYHLIERLRRELPEPKPPTYCDSALAERIAGQAHAAGVTLATGTDAPAPTASPWPAVFDEMDLLRKAGLPPLEVLRAATVNGARALGREGELGAIEPGKLANIAFLSENPLAGRAQWRSVVLTVKRGAPYWRRDYRPITAEEMGE